jgi:small subunit ribosomal protein S20
LSFFYIYLTIGINKSDGEMPQHKSCKKRLRTNEKARIRNRTYKSKAKRLEKKVLSLTSRDEAQRELKTAVSLIDRLVNKGIIHRNTAANHKAKLSRHVQSLQA